MYHDDHAQPMAAPDNDGPALSALENLTGALSSLEASIDRLHSKLSFVLGPESAEGPTEGDEPRHQQSAMTEALLRLADRVEHAESVVNEITTRVEV